MIQSIDPVYVVFGFLSVAFVIWSLIVNARLHKLRGALLSTEQKNQNLKTGSQKQEYRMERFEVLWFPTVTFSPLTKEIHQTSAGLDRKSTRLNSSHIQKSRMPSSA